MPIQRKDFTGLTDMYMDTAAYNLDPAIENYMLQDPKEIDQRRFRAYKYFMDFYDSKHWDETGEVNPAFGNRILANEEFNRRTWNVSKNVINKLVAFLVKEPWSIKLPAQVEEYYEDNPEDIDSESDAANNPIYRTLENVWQANDRQAFSYKMALMGMVTGDCFVKISYDPDFYAQDVGEIKLDVLDSRCVLPFFDGHNRDKLIGARIRYPLNEVQEDGSIKKVLFTEVHTDSSIVTFLDGELQEVMPNPLGEILIVHIKNEPLPWQRYGRSDLYDLIIPNKELNEKLSDVSEILAYHAAPITIIKGARVQQLEKGARKVWGGIPKDGDVYNLTLDADLSSSVEYIDKLKTHIHETSGVPAETMGQLQAISNTSGSALHLQYQPILDRIQAKQIDYSRGLMQVNRIIIRFYEAAGILEMPDDLAPAVRYKTTIKWGDALPRDRSLDLADLSTEIGLQIESKKGALKRLGVENPEAKLREIQDELMQQAEMDFMQAGLSAFGDPTAGADAMGAASGADDGTQNDVSGAVAASKTNPITQGSQTSSNAVKKSAQTTTNANKSR